MEHGEVVRRKVEPTMQDLSDKVDQLGEQARMSTGKVQSFMRENPLMALGLASLGGLIIGLIITRKRR